MDIYLLIEGQQTGPYTEDQVRQSLADGQIPSDLPAWHEGLPHWKSAADIVSKVQLPPPSIALHSKSRSASFAWHLKASWLALGAIVVIAVVAVVWLVLKPSLAKETYRSPNNSSWLTVVSSTEIEFRDKDGTFLGTYELQGDTIRAIFTTLGTPQVFYFKKVTEGWQNQGGEVFLAPSYFSVAQLFYAAKDKADKGDLDGAIADYNRVIETFPNNADAFNQRGDAQREKGNFDAAIADYNQAIALDPKSDASSKLDQVKIEQQQKADAARGKLIKDVGVPSLKTTDEPTTLSDSPLNDEQLKSLQQATGSPSADASAYQTLGIAYLQRKQYDEAFDAFNSALNLDPNDARLHNYLGFVCFQKGLSEIAEKELNTAIKLDPNLSEVHFNLAVVYATESVPSLGLARQEYQKALDLGAKKDDQLESLLK